MSKPIEIEWQRADDSALDSKLVTQPDIQSVGEHDEARGNLLIIRQHDPLSFRAYRDGNDFGEDRFDAIGNLGANCVDQGVVRDAVLLAGRLVEQVAEARDPVLAVVSRGPKHGVGDAGLAKALQLHGAAQLFDAKVTRIDRMRVDQNR